MVGKGSGGNRQGQQKGRGEGGGCARPKPGRPTVGGLAGVDLYGSRVRQGASMTTESLNPEFTCLCLPTPPPHPRHRPGCLQRQAEGRGAGRGALRAAAVPGGVGEGGLGSGCAAQGGAGRSGWVRRVWRPCAGSNSATWAGAEGKRVGLRLQQGLPYCPTSTAESKGIYAIIATPGMSSHRKASAGPRPLHFPSDVP